MCACTCVCMHLSVIPESLFLVFPWHFTMSSWIYFWFCAIDCISMLVAVHAWSVVYSLSVREFATPSPCFHVPIFTAAWCLKLLYSWWLYLLWWCLQLQWDFVAAGCFSSCFAQRQGRWEKEVFSLRKLAFCIHVNSTNTLWITCELEDNTSQGNCWCLRRPSVLGELV